MSYNTTPYINTPLTFMLYLEKPMRVLYCPEAHVVNIYIPMICKSGLIGKQYPTHEVMSLIQNLLADSRWIWKSLSSSAWCREMWKGWNWCRWRMRSTLVRLISISLSFRENWHEGYCNSCKNSYFGCFICHSFLSNPLSWAQAFSLSKSTNNINEGRTGWMTSLRETFSIPLFCLFGILETFPLN